MSELFCQHLDDYAALYTQAEASYQQCLTLVDRIVELEAKVAEKTGNAVIVGTEEAALPDLLATTVKTWEQETINLRRAFEGLISAGRVYLPRRGGKMPHCCKCKRAVPKLEFPEWQINDDGSVFYRGEEFSVPEPVAT